MFSLPNWKNKKHFFAIVQSVASYGILAWGGAHAAHLNSAEGALRGVLRTALRKSYHHPADGLYMDLDVPTLTETYARQLIHYRLTWNTPSDYLTHSKTTRHNTPEPSKSQYCRIQQSWAKNVLHLFLQVPPLEASKGVPIIRRR